MRVITNDTEQAALERDAARYRELREQVERGYALVVQHDRAMDVRHRHSEVGVAQFGSELDTMVDRMRPVDTRRLAQGDT